MSYLYLGDLKANSYKYAEYNFKETGRVSIAEAKSNFSEYISRVAFANEKLVITKRGKPVAGLVSLEDIKRLDKLKLLQIPVLNIWNDFPGYFLNQVTVRNGMGGWFKSGVRKATRSIFTGET